jgi:hypothetical protein
MIAPAPRKLIPVIIFEATRPDAFSAPSATETIVNRSSPGQISINVLNHNSLVFIFPFCTDHRSDRPSETPKTFNWLKHGHVLAKARNLIDSATQAFGYYLEVNNM